MAAPHVAGVAALCIGEGGRAGPCATLTAPQIVARVRADAQAYRSADPGSGFAGDPLAPFDGGQVFGFLAHVGPDTSLDAAPEGTTRETQPEFRFSSDDEAVTFQCSLDGAPFEPCASPVRLAPQADGPHAFSVRAIDAAGNLDASAAARSFAIDTAPPPQPTPTPTPDPTPAPTLAPTPTADVTAPRLAVGISSQRLSTVLRRGLGFRIRCSEACALDSRVLVAGAEAGRKRAGSSAAKRTIAVRLRSAVRRRLAGRRSVLLQLRIVATDANGNATSFRRSVRVRV
jgi:hypothetical protein